MEPEQTLTATGSHVTEERERWMEKYSWPYMHLQSLGCELAQICADHACGVELVTSLVFSSGMETTQPQITVQSHAWSMVEGLHVELHVYTV